MQLSVKQTITSTENNYKANVNFTERKYTYCRFAPEPKISNVKITKTHSKKENTATNKYNMEASSLTLRKKHMNLKGHISTAYKDNKKYTMYTYK